MPETSLKEVVGRKQYQDAWLAPEATAEFLSVTVGTLAVWRHQGRGPAFSRPTGRVVRYRLADIERYLAEAVVHSTSEADARDRAIAVA